MMRAPTVLCTLLSLGAASCSAQPESPRPAPQPAFARLAQGGENPADYGPDDSMVIDGGQGERLGVPFAHYKHASNAQDGFGVPCAACHHTAKPDEMPSDGCSACHGSAEDGDPASSGPDNNMLLGIVQTGRMRPVAFNHFTHASTSGYKLSCDSCHHTGDLITCDSCHGAVPQKGSDGKIAPKLKRAFHRQCQQCHHSLTAANPSAVAPTSCKGCHTGEVLARRPGHLPRGRAFHLSCTTCHQKDRLARPTSRGPTSCDGCHREVPPEPEKETPAEPDTSPKEQAPGSDTGLTAPPDHILIEFTKLTRPAAPFDHKLHAALGEPCAKCHHTGLEQPRCRDCHSDPVDGKKVFHKSCITCHKENGIPAACGDCHKKKAK